MPSTILYCHSTNCRVATNRRLPSESIVPNKDEFGIGELILCWLSILSIYRVYPEHFVLLNEKEKINYNT